MSKFLSNLGFRIISHNAHILSRASTPIARICCRNVYTPEDLLIHRLDEIRDSHMSAAEKRIQLEKIKTLVDTGNFQSFQPIGCSRMLFDIASTPEDLDLLEKTITRIELKGGDYRGLCADISRLYYAMNQVDRIHNILTDPTHPCHDAFSGLTSYQIAMTMLYNAGRYEDAIRLYYSGIERFPDHAEQRFHRLAVIVFASYARIGTPEAFQEALRLANRHLRCRSLHYSLSMRLVGYLAYKTGNDTEALKFVLDPRCNKFVESHSIATLAMLRLGRFEDVVSFLRRGIDQCNHVSQKLIFSDDVRVIRGYIGNIGDENIRRSLSELLDEITMRNLISKRTLEYSLFKINSQNKYVKPEQESHDAGNQFRHHRRRPGDSFFFKQQSDIQQGQDGLNKSESHFDTEQLDTRSHNSAKE